MNQRECLESVAGWMDAIAHEARDCEKYIRERLQPGKEDREQAANCARSTIRYIRQVTGKVADRIGWYRQKGQAK